MVAQKRNPSTRLFVAPALILMAALLVALSAASPPAIAYSGQIQWVSFWNPAGAPSASISASSIGPGGTIYALGQSGAGPAMMLRMAARRTNGSPVLWGFGWAGPADPASQAVDSATGPNGDALTVGSGPGAGGKLDWVVVDRRPSGSIKWSARYDGGFSVDDGPVAVAVDGAGNAIVTGAAALSATTNVLTVAKFDAADGHVRWAYKYPGVLVPARASAATDVTVDAAGNAYVSGDTWSAFGQHLPVLLKVTPDGRRAWARPFDDVGSINATALQVAQHGTSVYVAGYRYDAGGGTVAYAARYSARGVRKWLRVWSGLPKHRDVVQNALVVDGLGNPIIGGKEELQGADKGYVISWTPAGKRRWVAGYWAKGATPPYSRVDAIAADGAGNVWAVGLQWTRGEGIPSALLFRLTPQGKVKWARDYYVTADGVADFSTLQLWGKDSLFVAGSAQTPTGGRDAVVIKYQR